MSQSVLVTIPDELVEDFINHLGRMKPDISKHITIRVLDGAHAKRVIEEFTKPYTQEEYNLLRADIEPRLRDDIILDFPIHIPDDELDDDILPLEDIIGAIRQDTPPPEDFWYEGREPHQYQ